MITDDFGHWFAGLVDGEGCFHARTHIRKCGAKCLVVYFTIKLRSDDLPMLERIQKTLGVGRIYTYGEKLSSHPQSDYRINHRNDLRDVLIPIFDKYQLRSKKLNDYLIWRRIVLECKCAPRNHTMPGVGSLPNHIWDKAVILSNELGRQRQFNEKPDIAGLARERVHQTQPPLFTVENTQLDFDF